MAPTAEPAPPALWIPSEEFPVRLELVCMID